MISQILGAFKRFLEWRRRNIEESKLQRPQSRRVEDAKEATAENPKGFRFSDRSLRNLQGVHPVLVRVAKRAIQLSDVDFIVTEGLRTRERQKQLVAAGASRTLNSKHLTGHAIDVVALVEGKIRWDWPLLTRISKAFKEAAREQDVKITWGGDWKSFKDGPHFEIDPKVYTFSEGDK